LNSRLRGVAWSKRNNGIMEYWGKTQRRILSKLDHLTNLEMTQFRLTHYSNIPLFQHPSEHITGKASVLNLTQRTRFSFMK